ncbi:class I SAM-dependent methyltransferase [Abditibacterium utsteinense]|nr:class I SAM-dependent methyltransferase [Abditibacterium utsteinense]
MPFSASNSEDLRRADESDDALFYLQPRFVAHIESATIAAVTRLYRETLPSGGAILDLMSSWISHLPPEMHFSRVAGLGMSEAELAANPLLSDFRVQNLNRNPLLPFGNAQFDAALICVSVQYLTNPVAVMRELGRVLKPDAPLVISFSNRCFPTKATLSWQRTSDAGHLDLVENYLQSAGNWTQIEKLNRTPPSASEPLLAVVARRA